MNMDTKVIKAKTRTGEIELETHEIATRTSTPLHTTDWYFQS